MGAELHDMLDYRHVIEPGAAELAARRGVKDEDKATLLARLHAVRTASAAGHRVADSRLHLAIGELSGSPSVAAAVADVQVNLDRLLRAIPVLDRNIVHSNDQHGVIVEAILAGDERGARVAMTEHVEGTSALLRGFLA
jgi:DNA-binding GntR family transcriptional regulator